MVHCEATVPRQHEIPRLASLQSILGSLARICVAWTLIEHQTIGTSLEDAEFARDDGMRSAEKVCYMNAVKSKNNPHSLDNIIFD